MPASVFSMKVDSSDFEAALDDHVQRQFPYAASVALNRTGAARAVAHQLARRNRMSGAPCASPTGPASHFAMNFP